MLAVVRRFFALFVLASLSAAPAFAQSYTYSIYIDADNNASTGCNVSLPGGTVSGAETMLTATINAGSPPQVVSVTSSTCSGGSFGAPVANGTSAVSVGAGLNGTTSVEISATAASLVSHSATTVRLYVVAQSALGSDVLLTTSGTAGGGPILLSLNAPPTPGGTIQAPSMGPPAVLLLVTALLIFGSRSARRRLLKRALIGLAFVSGIAGAAIFNWNGIQPLAGSTGNSTSGETAIDLRWFFAALSNGNLYFRIDCQGNLGVPLPPPVAVADSYTTSLNTALTVPAPGVLGNDTLNSATISAHTNPTHGAVVLNANGGFVYTPANAYTGPDSFTYTLTNSGGSSTATVSLNVTAGPVAMNDSYATTVGTALSVSAAAGVLSNDQLGTPAATLQSFGGGSLGGSVTDHAPGTSATLGGVSLTLNANGSVQLAAPTTAGTYTFQYRIGNAQGTSDATVTIQVNQAPAITSANATTFTVGTAGTFTVTTTGTPVPSLAHTGTLPAGVSFVDNGNGTAILAGTPAAGSGGSYALVFTASNSAGSSTPQNFTLVVDQAPAFTSANSVAFTVSASGSFNVTATGYPAPTLSLSSGTLPSGVTFTPATGVLSGTPAAGTDGTYPLTFTATNGVGSPAMQSFTLTVQVGPAITSAMTTTFVAGSNGSFTVTATGTPLPSLSVGGTLPAGVSFIDNRNGTGTLSGTPSAGTGGTYPLTFTASNGIGAPATQSFTLQVNEAPVANGDAYTAITGQPFSQAAPGVLGNDTLGFPAATLQSFGGGSLGGSVTDNSPGALVSLAGGSFTIKADGSVSLTAATTPGVYTVQYQISNTVTSANAILTLTVNQPTTITSAATANFSLGTSGSFTISTNGTPDATSITLTGCALPTGLNFAYTSGATATISGTPSVTGLVTCTVTAGNGFGTAATQTLTVASNSGPLAVDDSVTTTVGNAINLTAPGLLQNDTLGFPAATLTSFGGGSLGGMVTDNTAGSSVALTGSGGTLTIGGDGSVSLTAPTTPGTYTVLYRITNSQGTSDATLTIQVNQAPQILSPATANFIDNTAATPFTITTSGTPTVTSITLTGCTLQTGLTFTYSSGASATISGTPTVGGSVTCTVTASNGVAPDATQTLTVTVDQGPAAVADHAATTNGTTLTVAAASGLLSNDMLGTPAATLVSFGGDSLGGAVTDNAAGASVALAGGTLQVNADGSFSLTTPTTAGEYTFLYRISNLVSNSDALVTIDVNQAPAITSINNAAFVVGQNSSFSVTTTGFPNSSLSSTGSLPSGVTFVDNGNGTATLSGTPAAGTAGTYPLTFTAHNGIGSDATQNFTLQVNLAPTVTATTPANGATAVLATAPISVTFSQAVNVTGTAFTLECPTGTPEGFTIAPAPPGNATTFTLTPSTALPAGAVCTVTAVASQIASASSNTNMQSNYVWSFTTDTAPTVTSTTPTSGATAVPLNSTIVWTFNKAVNVTASAFTLQCPSGTPVAFTLSPAPPGGATTFTLTPTTNLPAGTTCTSTAVAAQITDLAGTALSANQTVSFTTDSAPTVSSTTPANSATAVPLNSTVVFTFNKAVNVTGTAFTLQCPSGTPVASTVSPAPPGNATTFTLTPSANLPAGTVCVATAVASQITDAAGTNLAANYTVSFTTDVAPTVTSTTPTNGATNTNPSSAITITFSKAVNVTATAFTLQCPSGTPAAFTLAPAPPGNTTTFALTPTTTLPSSTTCAVTAVASQITDAAGTNLAADFNFSFTTATPPAVSATTPTNGATTVLATAPLSITFSQAVNVTATAFTLQCPTGTPEAFTLSPAPPGGVTTFTLTPSAALPAGTVCTVTAVASQITSSSSGVPLQSNYVWSFTTDTPPTVSSTTPANGATTVALGTTVVWTFNKAVNVTASAFTLQCPSGTPVAFTLSPAPPGGTTIFTLTPSAKLPAGTTCVSTAVASQISDLAGTNLAANVTTSFTTDSAPTVTSVTPANGATGVLPSTTLTVTFNKAVNVTATAFTLQCPTGTPETITLSPAPPGGATTFTLTPTANLPAGAVCTATVVASQVSDTTAGTALASNFTWSFTIDTPPVVSSTVPANGSTTFVDTNALSFTFNKAVNVTASAFTLQCPSGTPVAFTLSPAPPGGATTFTLTPSAHLPPNTACVATAVASQIADLAGTNMAANYTLSFTTIPPPPVANNDTYPENVVGNVSVNSALYPYSVTTNDTSQVTFTVTAFDSTSANGGTVSMTTSGANMGQFTYNPPAGFIGTDTFTYTITNTGGSATATVTMTVANIIWFINDSAGAGDGRLASPFNSLAAFQAVNDGVGKHPAANANIFLYDSGTGYTGPVTLLNGQKLIGQDATSSLTTITSITPGVSSATLPATGGGSPNKVSITSAGNTVTLGSGNTVWGLSLGNATGIALTGASVGSLKLRDLTINTTGAGVSLANGALDAIINSITSGGGTHGISLTTTTGSFDIEGGGASAPSDTTVGRTTAKSGGGTLTLGSGGTIQNATSAGVLLSNATNVTLRNVVIQNNGGAGVNNGGDGINASGSSNLTLDNDLVTGHTGNYGLYASTLSGLAIQHTQISSNATNSATAGLDIWNVGFGQETACTTCPDGLTGTATVANSLFETTYEDVFGMVNHNASTASLTVTNSQFTGGGNEGLDVIAYDTANVSASVSNSTLTNNPGGGFEYLGNNSSGGGTVTVTGSSFEGNGGAGGADISVFHPGTGKTVTFDIENNTTKQTLVSGSSASISVDLGTGASSTTLLQGKVNGNTVGKASITDSGSALSSGIAVGTNDPGTLTLEVENNTVMQTDDDGLLVLASSPSTSQINITASGNDLEVSPTDPNTNLGLELTTGGAAGTDVVCAHITGDSKEVGNSGVAGIATTAFTGAIIQLQGYGGAPNNNAAIATFLNGTATTVTPAGTNFGGGGTIEAAPVACQTPP